MGAHRLSVVQVRPTIVFDNNRVATNGGTIHIPVSSAAVPTRNAIVVTTLCGLVGLGQVKLRRGANCGECLTLRDQLELT